MKQRQRGAAVIVAILIVTLAASTASFAIWEQSIWVRQLENIGDRAKADQLATSAIDIARNVLKQDKDDDQKANRQVDDLKENWATKITLPGEDALVSGELTDQQGLFNLNNLIRSGATATPDELERLQELQRLLEILGIKHSTELATAIAEWVNNDTGSTVDLEYLGRNPPYRAAQREMVDVGELALIKGFTEDKDAVRMLTPYVTALKKGTTVNVNTAKLEVLQAMRDLSFAKTVVGLRDAEPLKDLSKLPQPIPNQPTCPDTCYSVKSDYFTVTTRVKSGRVESGYTALLDRSAGQWPSIKWRKDAAD